MEIYQVTTNDAALRQLGRISLDDFDLTRAQRIATEMYPGEGDLSVEHVESKPSKRSVYKRLSR